MSETNTPALDAVEPTLVERMIARWIRDDVAAFEAETLSASSVEYLLRRLRTTADLLDPPADVPTPEPQSIRADAAV